MPTAFQKKLLTAILLPLPLMLALSGLFLWQSWKISEESGWVEHTSQVLAEIELSRRLMADQEAGLRGFILSGDPRFLELTYQPAKAQLPSAVTQLRTLTADNPAQQERIAQMEKQYQAWLAEAEPERTADRQQLAAALRDNQVLSRVQKRMAVMEEVRKISSAMTENEKQLLGERRQRAESTERSMMIGGTAILVLLGLFLAWYLRQIIRRVDATYATALRNRETSEAKERQARMAAEALAEDITERSREMEKSFLAVRARLDASERRIAELEHGD